MADALFLLLILWLPGVDVPGSSTGRPFLTDTPTRILQHAPLKFHRRMTDAASLMGVFDRQKWLAPVDLMDYTRCTNEPNGILRGDPAHAGFYNACRMVYHDGWIEELSPKRGPWNLQ